MPQLLFLNGIAVESELVEESQHAFGDVTNSFNNTTERKSRKDRLASKLESKQLPLNESSLKQSAHNNENNSITSA
jgi:hypothetical protein